MLKSTAALALGAALLLPLTPAQASDTPLGHPGPTPPATATPAALPTQGAWLSAPSGPWTTPTEATFRLMSEGEPLAGKQVTLTRNGLSLGPATTDSNGLASWSLTHTGPGDYKLIATFEGDQTHQALSLDQAYKLTLGTTKLVLKAPKSVQDGKGLKLSAQTPTEGVSPTGTVTFKVTEVSHKRTRTYRETIRQGKVARAVKVYSQAAVTATYSGDALYDAATVSTTVKFTPKGAVVKLTGPQPRVKLPKQPLASKSGAAVTIKPIPNSVWKSMQGKSWRPGCTPRAQLRYMTVNYYSFDGYRRQGELIVAASTAHKFKAAFEGIYKAKLPIRSMYLVDRFGYSTVLRGADDYKSMGADNTSAFNCRGVVGNPSVRSPHTTGRSLDVNPWENPYSSRQGWTPNKYWVGKRHKLVAWRASNHKMVKTLKKAGFRWTYGVSDAHHFDS